MDVTNALTAYGFWNRTSQVSLLPATLVSPEGMSPIILGESAVVRVPRVELTNAIECSDRVELFPEALSGNDAWLLSTTGDVAVYCTTRAQHIFFSESLRVPSDVAEEYLEQSETIVKTLRRVLGIEIHTRCDWKILDDEVFEQLCYDVIRRCGRFDPVSVRKMGKARSRDGGRDLIAFTKSRPGHMPEKWIIQCKHLGSSRSLSGSMVQVADVIDQHGARGFVVMTNAVIDATLFDKLESICGRRTIGHETWSGMELERFLQGHQDLLCQYFGATARAASVAK